MYVVLVYFFFFFQAEDGIRDDLVTGVQTCALPISFPEKRSRLPHVGQCTSKLPRNGNFMSVVHA